jgi:hypothetical protein
LKSVAANTAKVKAPGTVTVSTFYQADDGNNLNPRFKKQSITPKMRDVRQVVNDLGHTTAEMWCPPRRTHFSLISKRSSHFPSQAAWARTA